MSAPCFTGNRRKSSSNSGSSTSNGSTSNAPKGAPIIAPATVGGTDLETSLNNRHERLLIPQKNITCEQPYFLYNPFDMVRDSFAARRRSGRKPVRKAIVLMIESGDPETFPEGTTVDMSEHGARIKAEAALTPGQTLSLIQPDDPPRSYRCMVVWTGNVSSDGQEQVGLEFLSSLSAELEN